MRKLSQTARRNVFQDLGFPQQEAEHLRVRADLMAEVSRVIAADRLTQREAASRLGVSQPRVSDLVRGKIERFSVDTLIEMLGRAGIYVRVTIRRPRVA